MIFKKRVHGGMSTVFFVVYGLFALAASDTLVQSRPVSTLTSVATLEDWPSHGGAADESGYSGLTTINTGTIGKLGLQWAMDLPGEVSLEATPLAVDGVLYFTGSMADVYAVDALSGKLLWKYDPQTWKFAPGKMNLMIYPVNRGVAYAAGKIFVAALDGRLIALDAKTGAVSWSVETIARNSRYVSTGAPRTFKDMVIIGSGGADAGARGYVTAYDQTSGKQRWRFYTVPGTPEENRGNSAMERAAATWNGEYWKTGTGGTVWNGITFDPELNQIYIGTSNGGPYDPVLRSPGGGDNLYLASMVALNADTGEYRWHYQVNPSEGWDYKATANMISATLTIDGKPRKVLMQAPTNGFFYVLDRETGKLISAEKIGKVTWADHIDLATGRPVETPNIRYQRGDVEMWPSSLGAHNWQAMSFNPQTGLVYIPYMHAGSTFSKNKPRPGEFSVGGVSMGWAIGTGDPKEGTGALLAWDPVQQREAWCTPLATIWNGGTLSTAGNLVFQGTADGFFSAYNATTGERLWQFNAGLGIISAPMSYELNGQQFISVLVGYGGSAGAASQWMHVGWKYGAQPRRLLTFSLKGTAQLAASPPPDMKVYALDDPTLVLNKQDVEQGRDLYKRCVGCHGRNLQSSGAPGPDLRESAIALQLESFRQLLQQGPLMSRGMPGFSMLTDDQIRQLHSYIRDGARQVMDTQKEAK